MNMYITFVLYLNIFPLIFPFVGFLTFALSFHIASLRNPRNTKNIIKGLPGYFVFVDNLSLSPEITLGRDFFNRNHSFFPMLTRRIHETLDQGNICPMENNLIRCMHYLRHDYTLLLDTESKLCFLQTLHTKVYLLPTQPLNFNLHMPLKYLRKWIVDMFHS